MQGFEIAELKVHEVGRSLMVVLPKPWCHGHGIKRGFTPLPEGYNRIAIQLGVEDSSGRGAYSVNRIIIIVDENEEDIAKQATNMFLNIIPTERGSPEVPIGRYFVSSLLGLGIMSILFASGAGAVPALAIGVLAGIEFVIYGMAPGYIAIIAVLILALVTVKVLINVFSGGQQV